MRMIAATTKGWLKHCGPIAMLGILGSIVYKSPLDTPLKHDGEHVISGSLSCRSSNKARSARRVKFPLCPTLPFPVQFLTQIN